MKVYVFMVFICCSKIWAAAVGIPSGASPDLTPAQRLTEALSNHSLGTEDPRSPSPTSEDMHRTVAGVCLALNAIQAFQAKNSDAFSAEDQDKASRLQAFDGFELFGITESDGRFVFDSAALTQNILQRCWDLLAYTHGGYLADKPHFIVRQRACDALFSRKEEIIFQYAVCEGGLLSSSFTYTDTDGSEKQVEAECVVSEAGMCFQHDFPEDATPTDLMCLDVLFLGTKADLFPATSPSNSGRKVILTPYTGILFPTLASELEALREKYSIPLESMSD